MNPDSWRSNRPELNALANGFEGARILVVGDLMLDRYVLGEVTRISPEAPVPVLVVKQERTVPGGAANVILNVTGIKAHGIVAGIIGNDAAGLCLTETLSKAGVDTGGLVVDPSRPTTCKTRVVSGGHQIVRLDQECTQEISDDLSRQLLERVRLFLNQGVSGVILSDYRKGALGVDLTEAVIRECRERNLPIFIDPKREDYLPYSGATCITPNQKEFIAASVTMGINPADVVAASRALLSRLECSFVLVTQGADGMTLTTSQSSQHLPALAEEVFDVSGAGDTVVAVMATALAAGLDLVTSAKLANTAASLVVRRSGTTPVNWEELYRLAGRGLDVEPVKLN